MDEAFILSIIILGLIIYSVNGFTLKISLLTLLFLSWWGLGGGAGFLLPWQDGLLTINSWVATTKIMILVGALAILLMSDPLFQKRETHTPVLVLMVALGSILLVSASNWLSVYLAIELPTLSLFILVAQKRGSGHSAEAGLKYFVLGALSSGLFLFGCALLCGLTGGTSIPCIDLVLNQGGGPVLYTSGVVTPIGSLLITGALLFKLSAAPFHMWAPDVYDGAPTTITALLATVPKVGVFSILVSIGPVANVLLIATIFSMVVGALGALNQTKIKRLLAYSGIAHMGFVLWGIEIGSFESVQASLIYMILYIIMTICAFAMVLTLGGLKNLIVEFSGLSRKEPALAVTLALIFLSIAGIPPLIGFFSKWWVLLSGITYQYYLISILAVVCSVVAGVYYVRIVKIIYFQADSFFLVGLKTLREKKRINFRRSLLIGASLYSIGFMIISPNLLLQLAHWATVGLF